MTLWAILQKTLIKNKDQTEWLILSQNYYNNTGKIYKTINYRYDENMDSHQLVTKYFYDSSQSLTATQNPDGTTDIQVNDPDTNRVYSYTLSPTGQSVTNSDSLCFNPLNGPTDYNSCKVSSISVNEQNVNKIPVSNLKESYYYQNKGSYNYYLSLDANHQYTDNNGVKHTLYSSLQQSLITKLKSPLTKGHALSLSDLNNFANNVKKATLNDQTPALSFIESDVNALGLTTKVISYVSKIITKNTYNERNQKVASSNYTYSWDPQGDLNLISTLYYSYNKYNVLDNIQKSFANDDKKINIYQANLNGLGYALSSSNYVNDVGKQSNYKYNSLSGLLIEANNSAGDKSTIIYDQDFPSLPADIKKL